MIITRLRLQEEHPMAGASATWPLPICDLNLNYTDGENGYILKAAVGLGPTALAAVVVGFDIEGVPIFDSIPDKRVLVLKIALNPGMGQSYSSLRDALYKLIGRSVYVKLMDDSEVVAQSTGFIQRIEPAHFTNRPELEVTVECEDGIFYAPNTVFLPSASYNTLTTPVLNYTDGTAPTGLEIKFQNTTGGSKTGFSISGHSEFWHAGPGDVSNLFEVVYPIDNNDSVTINTHPNSQSIILYDQSEALNVDIAGYLNAGAVWPRLYPGVNTFTWDLNWVTAWAYVKYIPKYWGV